MTRTTKRLLKNRVKEIKNSMNKNSNLFIIPFLLVIVVVGVVFAAGCTSNGFADLVPKGYAEQANNAPTVVQTHIPKACIILEYGNGVMIFKCDETRFAEALSEYIAKNNVTVTAIAGVPDRESYMRMIGYYVVVK
jgi:hypothetical protein